MKLAARRRAIELARRHPGWGNRRLAREVHVSHSTIARWLAEEGLAPGLAQVDGRRRREQIVELGAARPRLGESAPDPLTALGLARPQAGA
jgi:hypothetical protein